MRGVHRREHFELGDGDQKELAARIDHARKHVLGCIRDVERAGSDNDRTLAKEGLKSAFDHYFDLLVQSFNFQSQMEHARDLRESQAAENSHEAEMHQMAHVDFNERVEDIRERANDEAGWKQLEAEYEKTLRTWEAHVQKLFADRLSVIRSEQSGHADKAASRQTDALIAHVENDALARYLDGVISQALASGDAITVSAPAVGAGSSLIDALLARLGSADEQGRQVPRTMGVGEFDRMLDHLFS